MSDCPGCHRRLRLQQPVLDPEYLRRKHICEACDRYLTQVQLPWCAELNEPMAIHWRYLQECPLAKWAEKQE